jgi:hypothetical protein
MNDAWPDEIIDHQVQLRGPGSSARIGPSNFPLLDEAPELAASSGDEHIPPHTARIVRGAGSPVDCARPLQEPKETSYPDQYQQSLLPSTAACSSG